MISFKTTLLKFDEKGEKTGWTYIHIPFEIANKINPNVRVIYRVKGKIDDFEIQQTAILSMGEGDFILPINQIIKKNIRKTEGSIVEVSLELDTSELPMSEDLMDCLADDPNALEFFLSLPKSHQRYFSKWVESAKTIETKSKRIAQTVRGCAMRLNYGEMFRYFKNKPLD